MEVVTNHAGAEPGAQGYDPVGKRRDNDWTAQLTETGPETLLSGHDERVTTSRTYLGTARCTIGIQSSLIVWDWTPTKRRCREARSALRADGRPVAGCTGPSARVANSEDDPGIGSWIYPIGR